MNKTKYNKYINLLEDLNFKEIRDLKYNLINSNSSDIEILDEINYFINNAYKDGNLSEEAYKGLIMKIDCFYKKCDGYAIDRYLWLEELKIDNKQNSLALHHKELLNYFTKINKILDANKIDYFHASGFMGYILTNKNLERYHHDIDLYVNIDYLKRVINIFCEQGFFVEHTFEETKDMYRHGLKIMHDSMDIPIWLSFYEMIENKAMNICEFYEDKDGNLYTSKNYNSPLCCKLSLSNGIYANIPFISMSLDSIYCSKEGNRKKDIYDCKIIENNVNKENVEIIKKELSDKWSLENGMSLNVMEAFNLHGNQKVRRIK